MARGVNKVILIGNLGKDPELKSFPSGGSVCNVSVATSESWKDKDGQQSERTEWHNVVFHNKLAEIVQQYLRKGAKIYVEGKIRTRKWQDKEGKDRYITEIHCDEMQMLDTKGAGESGGQRQDSAPRASDNYRQASGGSTRAAPPPRAESFEDDDIPF